MKELFRPYMNKTPITTKWYRTETEALSWGKIFKPNAKIEIVKKDINELLKNRRKTGFRGLI